MAFSQLDYAMVQAAFLRSAVIHFETLGLSDISDPEVEGLVHMWSVIAYYIGGYSW